VTSEHPDFPAPRDPVGDLQVRAAVHDANQLLWVIQGQASLLRLDVGSGYEYWMGLNNFYVITRYNHSTYYAMAVYQLGKAVKARVAGLPGTRVAQGAVGEADATL